MASKGRTSFISKIIKNTYVDTYSKTKNSNIKVSCKGREGGKKTRQLKWDNV